MNSLPFLKKKWELTPEAFGRLLTWLDADGERAGQKYEEIRDRLIRIFVCRGCPVAEDLADEAINRVIRKLPEIAGTYSGKPELYFYGVAYKVFKEYGKVGPEARPLPGPGPPEDSGPEYACLERCMQTLPLGDQELVLQYYREEKQSKIDYRKELARRLGIEPNALRIRAYRIRVRLAMCIDQCLKSKKLA